MGAATRNEGGDHTDRHRAPGRQAGHGRTPQRSEVPKFRKKSMAGSRGAARRGARSRVQRLHATVDVRPALEHPKGGHTERCHAKPVRANDFRPRCRTP